MTKPDWAELDFEHDTVCDECGMPADFIRSLPVIKRVGKKWHRGTETTYIRAARCRDHCLAAARRFVVE